MLAPAVAKTPRDEPGRVLLPAEPGRLPGRPWGF